MRSISLNEVYIQSKTKIYEKNSPFVADFGCNWLQPKSATKGEFFHIFLSLIVSSWRHGLQMANEADEVRLGKWPC